MKEVLARPKPFVNIAGDAGVHTVVRWCQMLIVVDPLPPGTDAKLVPILRHPKTKTSWNSTNFGSTMVGHYDAGKNPDDPRTIRGYSIKSTQSVHFKAAAADMAKSIADTVTVGNTGRTRKQEEERYG